MVEVVRISEALRSMLDDPSSVPENQPYCCKCHAPKVYKKRRCEICSSDLWQIGKPRTNSLVRIEQV